MDNLLIDVSINNFGSVRFRFNKLVLKLEVKRIIKKLLKVKLKDKSFIIYNQVRQTFPMSPLNRCFAVVYSTLEIMIGYNTIQF